MKMTVKIEHWMREEIVLQKTRTAKIKMEITNGIRSLLFTGARLNKITANKMHFKILHVAEQISKCKLQASNEFSFWLFHIFISLHNEVKYIVLILYMLNLCLIMRTKFDLSVSYRTGLREMSEIVEITIYNACCWQFKKNVINESWRTSYCRKRLL